ncbi:carboxypeptidase-like regulatory domain-containing protein [Tamlana sp. 2201CG12-4]|uniref:carboxypeptidase-like regulatory domain-containing protein n=1 Tax=Tamlana sp. 2201CG12-4 TaxID=3112582 RepID=UPI002DBF8BC2|nr:carboxypeptidase-like regulatory domain-containing protein [Tamlana sp. 2201CG12-4]MEC3907418.1 carboxypeptidase-like regulatory domain-containing protein [Tamlana sp. 2201CG12-4]
MKRLLIFLTCSLFIVSSNLIYAQGTDSFKEITGKVLDSNNKNPLVFADIVVDNSNISTVTNSDGEFLLKIPADLLNSAITITHLGYKKKGINIASLKDGEKILLTQAITKLEEVSITTTSMNARELVLETLKTKRNIYNNENTLMTAFYRETIKKRRRNASLSEAVVKIHKQPYNNYRRDRIELVKARKNTDYTKLDTLALKLQGGPFSNLYTDMIKYPEFIFNEDNIEYYIFDFDSATRINDKHIYVVNFRQKKGIKTPLYYGKLYIDAQTKALTNAVYSLNVSNRALSSQMYVRKKPRKVDVYPTEATYRVNYRTKDGKWHYAYSNISLTFKVNWKRKLFNNVYTLSSEMAITDWEIQNTKIAEIRSQLLRPTTILTERASGFSDPRFWGAYNVIEPDKSIQSAIKKIQKQLKRT